MLSLPEIAVFVLNLSDIIFLKVQKEAQLTTSQRLQVQKENALTERAR